MIEVIRGNALDFTADMFAEFHTQIIDPPYSDHVHDNCASVGVLDGGMGAHSRDLGFPSLSDELRFQIALAAASVKRWSAIFSDFEGAHLWKEYAENLGAEYIRLVPWVRWSQPQLSGDRPCTGAEAVSIFHAQHVGARGGRKPIAKRWNGPGSLTSYERRCMRGKDKHPTEKPIDLMLDLVMHYSDPGESVLDLTAGACTTAVACRLLGRDCVCVEMNDDWARKGDTRARSPLSPRDQVRVNEWCESVVLEASSVPAPKALDGSDVKTYERAQRRLADVERVLGAL